MNDLSLIRTIAVSLAVTAGAFVSGCRRADSLPAVQPPPPTVTVAPVEERELIEWTEFTGRTAPVDYVEIRPRVSGYIQKVCFESGQLVNAGDLLFVIDARWHQAEFDRREAELAQAQVRLDNARREAERTEQLLANKAISIEEAEARQSRFQEAKAALLAAQAARDTARLDLEYTEVRAPIGGRVSRELVTEGNYASGNAGAATLLTTIVSVDPIHVYADVDENSLLRFNKLVRARQMTTNGIGKVPVEMQLGDEEDFPHKGYIESFDNRVDPMTGSILLRAVFPNNGGRILPGLFARIRIPASAEYEALLVDERAIGTDQAQKFVLTLTETNTVAYRPVTLGPLVDGKRIVRGGLQAGELVVQNVVLARVRPGMPVQPQQEDATAAASLASGSN